jgi:transposase
MLYASSQLSTAYFLKEELYKVLDEKDIDTRKKLLDEWIADSSDSGITAFKRCAETYKRWRKPILNSFGCKYSNGFTEGCNNKIKVLKRNAYGFRNFKRFRNRILFMFTNQARRA